MQNLRRESTPATANTGISRFLNVVSPQDAQAEHHPLDAVQLADKPAEDRAFWDGVAAWNRGTVSGDSNDDNYYASEPYNEYARWIHKELACGRVYAFSTDDHQDKAGFVRCVSDELNVIWCPYQ